MIFFKKTNLGLKGKWHATEDAGFTLVELLIVMGILGILAAVTLGVINTRTQRARAEDAVRQTTIAKLSQGIEGYWAAEGAYPRNDGDGDPLDAGSPDQVTLRNYIGVWPVPPAEFAGTYYYDPIVEGSITFSCISVAMATNPARFIKYVNPWNAAFTGGAQTCGGRVLKNCTRQCSNGIMGNDFLTCTQIDETPC